MYGSNIRVVEVLDWSGIRQHYVYQICIEHDEFKLWILSKIWLPNVKVKIYEMMNTKFKGNLLKNCEGGKWSLSFLVL
jgi:hypothetical protein